MITTALSDTDEIDISIIITVNISYKNHLENAHIDR